MSERAKKAVKDALAPILEQVEAEAEAEELEATPNLAPGTVVGRGTGRSRKVPWTMADVRNVYPDTTFTPEETLVATFQGVSVQLISGQEITCPAVFKGLYDEHRKAMRLGSSGNLPTPYGVVNVMPGAGALTPEPEPTPPT